MLLDDGHVRVSRDRKGTFSPQVIADGFVRKLPKARPDDPGAAADPVPHRQGRGEGHRHRLHRRHAEGVACLLRHRSPLPGPGRDGSGLREDAVRIQCQIREGHQDPRQGLGGPHSAGGRRRDPDPGLRPGERRPLRERRRADRGGRRPLRRHAGREARDPARQARRDLPGLRRDPVPRGPRPQEGQAPRLGGAHHRRPPGKRRPDQGAGREGGARRTAREHRHGPGRELQPSRGQSIQGRRSEGPGGVRWEAGAKGEAGGFGRGATRRRLPPHEGNDRLHRQGSARRLQGPGA